MEWLKKNKILVITALVLMLVLVLVDIALAPSQPTVKLASLSINGHIIKVEVAATAAEQVQGLSNRISLAPQTGMLFTYPTEQVVVFWMKDMQFPLDIIWIKDDQIVDILKDVPANQTKPLPTYPSPGLIDSVLEVNAGTAELYDIKPGDKITIQFN